jgi:SAM-dependent methyltransferase
MREEPANTFKEEEVTDYEKRRYRGIDQKLVDRREQNILRKIFKRDGEASGIVLDVPCGFGRFSASIQKRSNILISSDLSFHMVRRALQRNHRTERLFGVVADAKKGLPFKNRALSGIVSMRFFHHIHEHSERLAVLREFARISSDWIVLSYYRKNFLHELQRKGRRKLKKARRRISIISREEFKKELSGAGLEPLKSYPIFRGLHAQHILVLRSKRD